MKTLHDKRHVCSNDCIYMELSILVSIVFGFLVFICVWRKLNSHMPCIHSRYCIFCAPVMFIFCGTNSSNFKIQETWGPLFNTTSVLLIGHLAEAVLLQVVGNCHYWFAYYNNLFSFKVFWLLKLEYIIVDTHKQTTKKLDTSRANIGIQKSMLAQSFRLWVGSPTGATYVGI